MRPDFSVLFLTTLIGAGQGLFLALFTVQLLALAGGLPSPDGHAFFAHGSLLALALLAGGLVASFFHLGRPERAWRSAAMWRTSWLSREVIVLPALMGAVVLFGAAHLAGWKPALVTLPSGLAIDATVALGTAGTLLALALFLCTAMIYACLPFLREWASPLTVLNYTLLGGASGFTLAAAFSTWTAPGVTRFLVGSALVLTLLGAISRIASLVRNARLKPRSTLQTALGIKHPHIVQRSAGFLGGSFNTREFFHGRPASVLRTVKWTFLLLAFPVPLALLAVGGPAGSGPVLAAAFLVQYLGLLAERWFFFAQANHPQNLYYQDTA
jgi:DMSO reductase anchor subunit